MPKQLLDELAVRGGISRDALEAWGHGRPCNCRPLEPGRTVAPMAVDDDG